MKFYYSTYIVSNYYRNNNSDDPELYMHEDSALIAANSAEEAISKAKEWVLSKRREVMDISEPKFVCRRRQSEQCRLLR